jgi:hypothetical protein
MNDFAWQGWRGDQCACGKMGNAGQPGDTRLVRA